MRSIFWPAPLNVPADPCALVGHSYGGAVALVAALRRPQRVRAIALYEPTLFALVDAQSPPPNDADGIRRAVADAVAALAVGQPEAAAEHFIDFWMGAGSWARMPEARRSPIAASIVNVQGWGDALFNAPVPVAALSALRMPVLLMTGSESPASSLGVARILAAQLARVETIEFQGLGAHGSRDASGARERGGRALLAVAPSRPGHVGRCAAAGPVHGSTPDPAHGRCRPRRSEALRRMPGLRCDARPWLRAALRPGATGPIATVRRTSMSLISLIASAGFSPFETKKPRG